MAGKTQMLTYTVHSYLQLEDEQGASTFSGTSLCVYLREKEVTNLNPIQHARDAMASRANRKIISGTAHPVHRRFCELGITPNVQPSGVEAGLYT